MAVVSATKKDISAAWLMWPLSVVRTVRLIARTDERSSQRAGYCEFFARLKMLMWPFPAEWSAGTLQMTPSEQDVIP